MKNSIKKSTKTLLAFVLAFALISAVMVNCFTMVSFADPAVYSYTDFTSTEGQNKFTSDFTAYHGDDIHNDGFYISKFDSNFTFTGGALKRTVPGAFTTDQFWIEANTTRTDLYFNKGKLKDFKLVASITSNGSASDSENTTDWFLPSFKFGVQDPNSHDCTDAGLNAYVGFNPGGYTSNFILTHYDTNEGDWKSDYSPLNNFTGGKYSYTYTLEVKDGKATFTTSCNNWEHILTHTFDLPATYEAGAVGLSFLNVPFLVYSVEITGDVVPGSKIDEDPGDYAPAKSVYDLTSAAGQAAFNKDFWVYSSETADTTGLERASFSSRFAYKNKALELVDVKNTSYDLFWQNHGKSVTRLMFNKGDLNNFTLRFRVEGSSDSNATGWADWIIPSIVFGSDDPKLMTGAGSGFVAGNTFNPGGSLSIYHIKGFNKDGGEAGADDTVGNPMYGGKYTYYYTLSVKDGKAKLTVTLDDSWEQETSYEVDLGSDYTPGAIGIQLHSSKTRITYVSVTGNVIESSVIDPNPGEDPDKKQEFTYSGFDTTANQDALKGDFWVYYSDDVATDGELAKADFSDCFEFSGSILKKKETDTVDAGNFLDKRGNNITRLIFNKGDVDDFEMTVKAQGMVGSYDSLADYFLPSLMFGIKDPNNFKDSKSGYEATPDFAPGGITSTLTLSGYDKAAKKYNTTLDYNKCGFYGGKYECEYKVVVNNGIVTYSYKQFDGSTYSATFTAPDYKAGAIGISFLSCGYNITSIDIKANPIPESVVDPEPGAEEDEEEGGGEGEGGEDVPTGETVTVSDMSSSTTQEYIKNNFSVYHSTTATEGLKKADFDDHFKFDGSYLVSIPDGSTNYDANRYLEQRDNDVTTLVFDSKTYDYFELNVTAVGSGTSPLGEGFPDYFYPHLLFGVQDPTLWLCDGSGYDAYEDFCPGGVTTPMYIRGYDIEESQVKMFRSQLTPYCGGKYEGVYTVRVYKDKMTISFSQFDGGVVASESFDLPASYAPGKVGIVFPDEVVKVRNITITDLGKREGEYVRPVAVKKYYGKFSNEAARKAVEEDFDVYHGDNAVSNLTKAPLTDWFKYEGNNLRHIEDIHYATLEDFKLDQGRNITTMLYNKQKFVNFEFRVRILSSQRFDSGADFLLPRVLFGVTTPTQWAYEGSGWKCMPYFVPYEVTRSWLRGYDKSSGKVITEQLEHEGNATFYGGKYNYDYIVRVENGKVTFTTVHVDWQVVTTDVFDLPEDYKGGAVGFALSSDAALVQEMSITNLDTEETAFVEGAYEADVKEGPEEEEEESGVITREGIKAPSYLGGNTADTSKTGGNTQDNTNTKTETETTNTTSTGYNGGGSDVSKTGDSSMPIVWVAVLLLSAGSLTTAVCVRRKRRAE